MNLMCDESVERPVVERLRADGHSVVYVAELSPGITVDEVLAQANTLSAALVTSDKDFGELVYRQRRVHSGDSNSTGWPLERPKGGDRVGGISDAWRGVGWGVLSRFSRAGSNSETP